jgi:hypothetical protein
MKWEQTMNAKKTYKRKLLNFSVKRDMQFKMIAKIFLLLFISLLLSGAIFYQFANQEVTSSFQMFHIKARNFLDFLFPFIHSSFAISLTRNRPWAPHTRCGYMAARMCEFLMISLRWKGCSPVSLAIIRTVQQGKC